jgi:hypothetical protein
MLEKTEKIGFILPFILFCLFHFILILSATLVLVTDDIYYNAFGDQLTFERINEIIETNKKWSWVVYPVIPLIYLFKFFLIVICLSAGSFLFRLEVSLKYLFKIALLAEFIFLLPPLIKLFWFSFINVNYTLNDLQFFSPLSVINLLDRTNLEPWLVYPLTLINLFEVIYIVTLSYLFAKTIESSFIQSLKLVILSYGTGLFIWILFITFLTVSLSA